MRALFAMCWLVTGGCNAVFDLDQTTAAPRPYYDAPPDAAFTCPGAGFAPTFKRRVVQVVPRNCIHYTTSQRANLALAYCHEPTPGFYSGPIDGALERVVELAPADGHFLDDVRLSADGDMAVGRQCDTGYLVCESARFVRGADGTWARGPTLGLSASYATQFSQISRGPDRRLFVSDRDLVRYEEYAEQADRTWLRIATYTLAELGLREDGGIDAMLAPDGLRMLAYGQRAGSFEYELLYFDRATLADRFRLVGALDIPLVGAPVLTEDCARLYFTALGSVLYVERE